MMIKSDWAASGGASIDYLDDRRIDQNGTGARLDCIPGPTSKGNHDLLPDIGIQVVHGNYHAAGKMAGSIHVNRKL